MNDLLPRIYSLCLTARLIEQKPDTSVILPFDKSVPCCNDLMMLERAVRCAQDQAAAANETMDRARAVRLALPGVLADLIGQAMKEDGVLGAVADRAMAAWLKGACDRG